MDFILKHDLTTLINRHEDFMDFHGLSNVSPIGIIIYFDSLMGFDGLTMSNNRHDDFVACCMMVFNNVFSNKHDDFIGF